MIDPLGRKERPTYCRACNAITWHVWIDGKWHCEGCDPTLIPDPILIGFTMAEVIELRRSNGQKHSS